MAKLSEDYVVEFLHRQGYAVVRGVRKGVNEWDIFAIKVVTGSIEARHVEVQVSYDPVSYLSSGNARKRSDAEVESDMGKWLEKKFVGDKVRTIRNLFYKGEWQWELVHGELADERELDYLRKNGVTLRVFNDVVDELCKAHPRDLPFVAFAKDAVELVRNLKGKGQPTSLADPKAEEI